MAPSLNDYPLTTGDVAKRLGVSIDTVQRWTDEGRIEAVRLPGKRGWRRYADADVERFATELLTPESAA